jgi:hypothetical protein
VGNSARCWCSSRRACALMHRSSPRFSPPCAPASVVLSPASPATRAGLPKLPNARWRRHRSHAWLPTPRPCPRRRSPVAGLAWSTTGCTARRRSMHPTTPLLTWIRWPRHYAPQRRLRRPGASSITPRLARRPPTRWISGLRSVWLMGTIASPIRQLRKIMARTTEPSHGSVVAAEWSKQLGYTECRSSDDTTPERWYNDLTDRSAKPKRYSAVFSWRFLRQDVLRLWNAMKVRTNVPLTQAPAGCIL